MSDTTLRSRRSLRPLVVLLALLAAVGLAASGCGIPTDAAARPINRDALPETLVSQATTTTAETNLGGLNPSAKLFLISSKGETESLSPIDVEIVNVIDPGSYPREVIEQLIAQQPRGVGSNGLTNAIPPTSNVLNASVDGDVLDLDLSDLGAVEGSGQRLAAAQIVFTATAIPGIRGVRFSIDGEPAAVPLDEHAADVGQIVTRGDYPSLNTF